MDAQSITLLGVLALIIKELFVTVRALISKRNGSSELSRAERLATVETKVSTIEKEQAFIKKAVYQMRLAMAKKGWIKS